MEGRCFCAIGRFASGALIKLRCASIGNDGVVRFTIETSLTGTVASKRHPMTYANILKRLLIFK